MKPILVGESNPYGADPRYCLYPAPEGCSGERLCCLILGMYRKDYLESFDRTNLCQGKWSVREAREKARSLAGLGYSHYVLCGAKVCSGFGIEFKPFTQVVFLDGRTALVIPHPSGRNTIWNSPDSIQKCREAVAKMFPDIANRLGKAAPYG